MQQPISTNLQPWPLAMAAFRRVWQERDDLLRLAAAPVVVTFLMNLWLQRTAEGILGAIQPGQQPDPDVMQSLQAPIMWYAFFSWCVVALFSANWIRFLMLGSASVTGLGLAFGRRHFRLLLLSVALQIAASLVLTIVLVFTLLLVRMEAVIFAVMVMFLIWYLIVIVRLCPVWVGIAIDAPMKLQDAWRRTEGHGIKLAVAFVVISFLLLVPQVIFFASSMSLGVTELAPLALSFVSVAIQFIMFAAIGAIFVLAYPRFVSETV